MESAENVKRNFVLTWVLFLYWELYSLLLWYLWSKIFLSRKWKLLLTVTHVMHLGN